MVKGTPYNTTYSTNFTSYDASYWTLEDECAHCGGSGHGDECTFMTPSAIVYNSSGATITTTRFETDFKCINKSNTSTPCKSGHMLFNPMLLYGTVTVRARWFPGTQNNVNTSTGFIGLDSPTNIGSITFGFHGKGWLGHDKGADDFSHEFQTALYSNVTDPHNREYIKTPDTDLADDFNIFQTIWHPDKVEWTLNGKTVRKVTNVSIIPNLEMNLKLHTRSGYCHTMPVDDSFYAQITYFEYTPYNP